MGNPKIYIFQTQSRPSESFEIFQVMTCYFCCNLQSCDLTSCWVQYGIIISRPILENPGNFCFCIRNPANFCCGIRNLGLWNREKSSRNLEYQYRLGFGIQVPLTKNPESTAWNLDRVYVVCKRLYL